MYYSPYFYYNGCQLGIGTQEKYKTDFYLKTNNLNLLNNISKESKIKEIIIYHPALIQLFSNPCLSFEHLDNKDIFTLITKNSPKKVIEINNNNIKEIELGGVFKYSLNSAKTNLNINTENYLKLVLINEAPIDDFMVYLNEINVFINAYIPTGLKAYKTKIRTENDIVMEVVHRDLGKQLECSPFEPRFVKNDFFEYIEKIYKIQNLRNRVDNKLLPLDFKKPTSLEDQFCYYFRYIDMYMGSLGIKNNFKRIETFINQNLNLFELRDQNKNLANEINSLRNHLIHEGYYFPNKEFEVTSFEIVLYKKTLDYNWLDRIIIVMKEGVFKIIYKEILNLDLDQDKLKSFCKHN